MLFLEYMMFSALNFSYILLKLTSSFQMCEPSFIAFFLPISLVHTHYICVCVCNFFFLVGKKRCLILKPKGGIRKALCNILPYYH